MKRICLRVQRFWAALSQPDEALLGEPPLVCRHVFVDGFGGMWDAVVCTRCGLDKYPEAVPFALALARLQGRYISENHHEWDKYAEQARAARERRRKLEEGRE